MTLNIFFPKQILLNLFQNLFFQQVKSNLDEAISEVSECLETQRFLQRTKKSLHSLSYVQQSLHNLSTLLRLPSLSSEPPSSGAIYFYTTHSLCMTLRPIKATFRHYMPQSLQTKRGAKIRSLKQILMFSLELTLLSGWPLS